MKKTLKKVVASIMSTALVASMSIISAGAYNIGDVINFAQPTDIIATINGHQLMSYNVDGYTYIVAEDLRHYGFAVNYDNATRSLSIERNSAVTDIAPHNTNANFWSIGSNKTNKNILYTDIVTYIAGAYVGSCNIDGATIIKFDELSRFGLVSYDNDRREISLSVSDMAVSPVDFLADLYYSEGVVSQLKLDADNSAKTTYGNNVSCDLFVRAKGNVLVFETYLKGIVLNEEQRAFEQAASFEQSTAADIKAAYQELKTLVPQLGAVALIMYDGSNSEVASVTIPLD